MSNIVPMEPFFVEVGDPKCHARHIGMWMIEESWFFGAISAIKDGVWPIRAAMTQESPQTDMGYTVTNGVAKIEMVGQMQKGESKFGGTNTVATRMALRRAAMDKSVGGIMLHVDSPGGTVAGTEDLARDVRMVNGRKPVYAHMDDLGASAAYWVGSQARQLSANQTAEVGSIGTVAVVEDTSKAAEMAGVQVHVFSTGKYKGAFVDGKPVSADDMAYLQARVNALNEFFLAGIHAGRPGLSMATVRELATGQVWLAGEAQKLGLIDKVQTYDRALADLRNEIERDAEQKRSAKDEQMRKSRMQSFGL